MTKEEFITKIDEKANDYALETVMDPDNHQDAVAVIKEDFRAGAYAAYSLFNAETI